MMQIHYSHDMDELMDWVLDWTFCEIRSYENGPSTASRSLMETVVDMCALCVEIVPKWQSAYDSLIEYKTKATMGRSFLRIRSHELEMKRFQINDLLPSGFHEIDTLNFSARYIMQRDKTLTESHTRHMVDSKQWELPLKRLEDTQHHWMFAQRFVDYTCWWHTPERLIAYWPLNDSTTHVAFKTFVTQNVPAFDILAKCTWRVISLYEWAVMEWCKYKRWLKMRMVIYSMDCLKILHRGFVDRFDKSDAYFAYRVNEHSMIYCDRGQVLDYLQPFMVKKQKTK